MTDERDHTREVGTLSAVTSFGRDDAGELYLVTHGGEIYQLVWASSDEPAVPVRRADSPAGVSVDMNEARELADGASRPLLQGRRARVAGVLQAGADRRFVMLVVRRRPAAGDLAQSTSVNIWNGAQWYGFG